MVGHMSRALLLASVACLALAACRSTAEPPPELKRTPVEKPWTKETVEAHEYVWIELSTRRRGFMTGPTIASDDKGEYLTTKDDASVHLPLSDVLVMDAVPNLPQPFDRTPIEKPWTKAAVEAHDHVWIETKDGRRQLVKDPVVASDEQGEYLTTKTDPTVHLPLSDVVVLDAATQPSTPVAAVAAQSLGGSLFLLWTGFLLFLPAIILVALIA
jgi:hypothetical protein